MPSVVPSKRLRTLQNRGGRVTGQKSSKFAFFGGIEAAPPALQTRLGRVTSSKSLLFEGVCDT